VTSADSPYRGVRALVTGATGFIGRNVALELAKAGAEVWLGVRDAAAAAPLAGACGSTRRIVELAAEASSSVTDAVAHARPAIVFNLAGYGVAPDERDPETARIVNAWLPVGLGRAAAEMDPGDWTGARIVHVGSALEYGRAAGDLSEETPPLPTTLYGKTKLEGTLGLVELGLPALTARLFTVYGPGEPDGRLLPSLTALARGGGRLAVTEGSQRRDFTYVGDVAEGLLRLGALGRCDNVVNLATGVLATVREFIETAQRVLEIPAERIVWGEVQMRPEEMSHDPVSIVRLCSLTGWRPETTIAVGIERTLESLHGRNSGDG